MSRRRELRRIVNLSLPVVIAELGWVLMGVVDTVMVSSLGPSAIGAVSIGNAMFDVAGFCGIGLVLGLDTVVSQAFGGGKYRECDNWLWQGVYLAVVAAPLLMLAVLLSEPAMRAAGVQSGVLFEAVPYMRALNYSLPPLLLYAVFRRYLQGIGIVKPVMFALVSANIVNAAGNYFLISRFGVEGVGWATFAARIYMAGFLGLYAFVRTPALLHNIPLPHAGDLRHLLRLGLPAAGQILIEVGVFATATTLAGKLAPEALAAHHIVLSIASTTFMVPLGMSTAGAVLVGQSIGAGEPDRAKHSGWMTIAIAGGFMTLAALVMLIWPLTILGLFTSNTDVLRLGAQLLFAAALFQIFDGVQVTATGVLRGSGNTKTPMLANLMAHWLVGLPAGYTLCFFLGFGVFGIWLGLSAGLIAVAVLLLFVWSRTRL